MKKIFTLFAALLMVMTASAQWDETVTASTDGTVLPNAAAIEGVQLTFNGATSIEVLEDGMLCLTENEDGWPILMVWGPEYGGTYTINGNTVTTTGWVDYSSVAAGAKKKLAKKAVIKKAAAADSWYIQDYGTFMIDGKKNIYIDDIAVAHEEGEGGAEVAPLVYLRDKNMNVGQIVDGGTVDNATVLMIQFPTAATYVAGSLNKVVTDYDWENQPYEYEEEIVGLAGHCTPVEGTDNMIWQVDLGYLPAYHFQKDQKYYLVVNAWTEGDENTWWDYDRKYRGEYYFFGTSEEENIEPAPELDMSWAEWDVTGVNDDLMVVPADFEGITIKFPYNNVVEAIGDTEAFLCGALQLKVVEAYLCEADPLWGEFDITQAVATDIATGEEYDSVDIFVNAGDKLEPNKFYVAVIPQRGIRLLNLMEYGWDDTDYETGVLWTNSGEWEMITAYFHTAETTGISSVNASSEAKVAYNLQGQRVNANVKGIKIINGKKVVK